MSSSIFRDLQEREDRISDERWRQAAAERPWSPEIIWQSEWHQGFGEEAMEFIGRDDDKYYCAFTRSPSEDEQDLFWSGPYDSREEAKEHSRETLGNWLNIRGEIEEAYEEQKIAEYQRRQVKDVEKTERQQEHSAEVHAHPFGWYVRQNGENINVAPFQSREAAQKALDQLNHARKEMPASNYWGCLHSQVSVEREGGVER
jgi:hypothetical protein